MTSQPKHMPSPSAPTAEERFVDFQYKEMKDLTKHFLTLIAGTLVLTLTVAEKLVGEHPSPLAKQLLGFSWSALVLAFILAGTGLAGVFFAALAAREDRVFGFATNYRKVAMWSYLAIDLAGVLYVAALVLLVAVGLLGLSLR